MEIKLKYPPSVERRNLVRSGASVVISLPQKWLKENDLSAGSSVIVIANGDLQILKASQDNIDKLNEKILHLRDQLNRLNYGQAGSPAISLNNSRTIDG